MAVEIEDGAIGDDDFVDAPVEVDAVAVVEGREALVGGGGDRGGGTGYDRCAQGPVTGQGGVQAEIAFRRQDLAGLEAEYLAGRLVGAQHVGADQQATQGGQLGSVGGDGVGLGGDAHAVEEAVGLGGIGDAGVNRASTGIVRAKGSDRAGEGGEIAAEPDAAAAAIVLVLVGAVGVVGVGVDRAVADQLAHFQPNAAPGGLLREAVVDRGGQDRAEVVGLG